MTSQPKTVTVVSRVNDKNMGNADYWGTPISCRLGDSVEVAVGGGSCPKGPPRISNGVRWFDPEGRRLTPGDSDTWSIVSSPDRSDKNFLCPALAQHALVGKFGNGEPFLVGNSWKGTATSNTLYLAVNDRVGQFANNQGDYTIDVKMLDFPIDGEIEFVKGRRYYGTNGRYLTFQSDGNIVVYQGEPIPANATWGLNWVCDKWQQTARSFFNVNGHLTANASNGATLWESNRNNDSSNTQLELTEAGKLRIRRPAGPGGPELILWDGN